MVEKLKKEIKMPSSYTVLMIIIVIMAILTWIIPAGKYQSDDSGGIIAGTYKQVEQNPQGVFDVLMAPIRAMLGHGATSAAIDVALFIFMIGAFLGVVNETGSLNVGLAAIIRKYKGREKMLIPILMFLFALGGSTYGMGEETMAFYPLLVPVMLAVGFDTITGVAIILLGSQIGCLASTINPFATGIAAANFSVADGIIWRILQFVVLWAVSSYFVYRYASKIEKEPQKSLVYKTREADIAHFNVDKMDNNCHLKLTKPQKRVLFFFFLTFIFMIASFIPWIGLNVYIFSDFNTWLTSLPILGSIIGKSTIGLGSWYFPEGAMLFAFMAVVIGFVGRLGEKRIVDSFMAGAGELLSVSLICAVARGIQVVMNDGMITATILHLGETGLKGLSSQVFIILTYIFYLPMSFLIPSSSGLAGATIGIMAPLGKFSKVPVHLIITAFQSASGVLNLIAPTSGIVMGALSLGRIEIGIWWKFVGKLVLSIVLISICILVIASFF